MTDTSRSSPANPLTGDHILLLAQALNANSQAMMDLADSNRDLARAMEGPDDDGEELIDPPLSMDGTPL